MRKTLMTTAAMLCLGGAAMAQVGAGTGVGNSTGVTQSPPNSGAAAVPGPGIPAATTGHGRPHAMPHHGGMRAGRGEVRATPAEDSAAPPTSAYRGGAGSPLSTQASNTTSANTRSEIAPRLPDPNAASNSPQAYLAAAQRALNKGQTGAAQEALERAETRVLSRSTEPSLAGQPDDAMLVRHISDARRALAGRNVNGAKSAIAMAMASGPGEPASPMAAPMGQPGLAAPPGRAY